MAPRKLQNRFGNLFLWRNAPVHKCNQTHRFSVRQLILVSGLAFGRDLPGNPLTQPRSGDLTGPLRGFMSCSEDTELNPRWLCGMTHKEKKRASTKMQRTESQSSSTRTITFLFAPALVGSVFRRPAGLHPIQALL